MPPKEKLKPPFDPKVFLAKVGAGRKRGFIDEPRRLFNTVHSRPPGIGSPPGTRRPPAFLL